jgi:hypothetical protein
VTNAGPNEPQRRMPNGGGHATHLAVFAFDELECDPAIGNRFAHTDRRIAWRDFGLGIEQARATGERAVVVDHDAAAGELRHNFGGGHAFDLCPIFAAMLVAWVEEA